MAREILTYTVSQKLARNIDIRTYRTHLVAEVTSEGKNRSDAANKCFRLLADYIFGNNTSVDGQQTDIAMIAPVVQSLKIPDKLEVIGPVIQQSNVADQWAMQFAMPARYTLVTLPQPNNPQIKIFEKPNLTVVAIRFAGFTTQTNIAKHEALLRQMASTQKLSLADAPATYAFYNPPWTLPWWRRNEIWLTLTSYMSPT